jgi:hypothetical protein
MNPTSNEYLVVTFAPGFEFLSAHETHEDAEQWIAEEMEQQHMHDYVAIIKAERLYWKER